MATETISWNSIVGGASAPLDSQVVDNGEIQVGFTPNAGSAGNVTVDTTATSPDNSASNPDNSQMTLAATTASPTSVTMNFADDAGSGVTNGAYNATFIINDIDAGSVSGGFRDKVTIKALDENGNPLSISASPNSRFTVTTNPDGSVTLLANPGQNTYNAADAYSQITVSGGPIASITVGLENVGIGSNNIMLTNVTYQTQQICFAAGTLIETDRGEVAVEELEVGDLVRTLDHGLQPVRWIASDTVPQATLSVVPHLRPVRISAGALGGGLPERDLIVSPQHRVMVRSPIARKMMGDDEVLVAAKQLVLLDGIDIVEADASVTYVHFLCDQHEVVIANGAPCETLFTWPEALKSVGRAAREEIFALFPELGDINYTALASRPLVSGRVGRRLAHRHRQNNKPLMM